MYWEQLVGSDKYLGELTEYILNDLGGVIALCSYAKSSYTEEEAIDMRMGDYQYILAKYPEFASAFDYDNPEYSAKIIRLISFRNLHTISVLQSNIDSFDKALLLATIKNVGILARLKVLMGSMSDMSYRELDDIKLRLLEMDEPAVVSHEVGTFENTVEYTISALDTGREDENKKYRKWMLDYIKSYRYVMAEEKFMEAIDGKTN